MRSHLKKTVFAYFCIMMLPTLCFSGPFGYYPTYHETDSLLTSLTQKYPALLRRFALSQKTIENRDIYAAKLSNSPNVDNKKPMALITGVQHASEPIGAAVIRDDIVYLLENYDKDYEAKWLVDNRQIYLVPIMNPDGYEYILRSNDQAWRKNRRPHPDNTFGVDLNRNYPYKWGYDNVNSSGTPSAFTYRGATPASEPETKSIMALVNQNKFRTWQNHHSDSDVLVIPFGYDYHVRLPIKDSIAYESLCVGQQSRYGRFTKWGPSFISYNGWALNGGTEDWGWSDSATYKIYTIITELGKAYWETEPVAKVTSQKMVGADLYMIESAGFYPRVGTMTVSDQCTGCNRNGVANPGETVGLKIQIKNQSVVDTTLNVRGFLRSASNALLFSDSLGSYGNVVELATPTNDSDPFTIVLSGTTPPNSKIPMQLRMTWELNSVAYEKILPCSLQVGPMLTPILSRDKIALSPLIDVTSSPHQVVFHVPPSIKPSPATPSGKLRIYSGKTLVREFVFSTNKSADIVWNKMNVAGNPIASGQYFAEWSVGTTSVSDRFTVLP